MPMIDKTASASYINKLKSVIISLPKYRLYKAIH